MRLTLYERGTLVGSEHNGVKGIDRSVAPGRALATRYFIILVELPEAVDDIEALVAVPGIDIISVATRDLSLNMGHPDDPGHPEVAAARDVGRRAVRA